MDGLCAVKIESMKQIFLNVFVFGLTAFLAAANPVENKPLKIARGMKYELRITGVPKVEMKMWNGQYRVDADGFLKLPLLGRVKIKDMTLDQAGTEIRSLLRDRMIYPQANIKIKSLMNDARQAKPAIPDGEHDGQGDGDKPPK